MFESHDDTGADEGTLIVHDYLGHSFQIGLSNELARRGRRVTHLYRADLIGPRGDLHRTTADAVVRAVAGSTDSTSHENGRAVRPDGNPTVRYARAVRQAALAAVHEARAAGAVAPATLLTGNAPPRVQGELLRVARAQGWRYVYWLQDVYSAAASSGRCETAWEAHTLRGSDHVVAVTDGFARAARALGVAPERITVEPNWAPLPTEYAPPGAAPWPPVAAFRRTGDPVLLYAGTLDERHAPELLAHLAVACGRAGLGHVVVVSQGAGRELLERWRSERRLTRLTLLDLRPYDEVPAMMAAADVLLVTLAHEAADVSAPSKLLSCLAAGRCVLTAAPPGTETARVVAESGGGVVADPRDAAAFCAAAVRLLTDPQLRARHGAAGRVWARRTFRLTDIADRFTRVL